jgi:hypothetical protein
VEHPFLVQARVNKTVVTHQEILQDARALEHLLSGSDLVAMPALLLDAWDLFAFLACLMSRLHDAHISVWSQVKLVA